MRYITRLVCLAGLSLAAPAFAGAAGDTGKQLHDGNCQACHAKQFGGDPAAIYQRANRMVKNRAALRGQVQRCEQNMDLGWFDDQIDAVTRYLNDSFYRFKN